MGEGYKHHPEGLDGIAAKFRSMQEQIDAIRSGASNTSSVIGRGGVTVKDNGAIKVIGTTTMFTGENGRAGMTTHDGNGNPLTPSNVLTVDGFLCDAGGGIIGGFRLNPTLGCIDISASGGYMRIPYTTTGSAANTRLLADGSVQQVTSSARYKRDIEDFNPDPRLVMELRPVTFRQKDDVKRHGDKAVRNVGFIAEEMWDPLPELVECIEPNVPETVSYDRVPSFLVLVSQDQYRLIDSLTERVDVLERAMRSLTAVTKPRWSLLGFTPGIVLGSLLSRDVVLTFPTPMPTADYEVKFGEGHSAGAGVKLAVAPNGKSKTSVTVRVSGLSIGLAAGSFMAHVFYPEVTT